MAPGGFIHPSNMKSASVVHSGRQLFALQKKFVKSAISPAQWPSTMVPEVAFSGRSNVGKSSLINALVNQKQFARVSKTPGRTQTVNFFDVGSKMHLVDLPGYGFAKAPKPLAENWAESVEVYLRRRAKAQILKNLYVLIDSRRGILEIDLQWFSMLQQEQVPFTIVYTKSDRVGKPALDGCRQQGLEQLNMIHGGLEPLPDDAVLVCSAKDGTGLTELKDSIHRHVMMGTPMTQKRQERLQQTADLLGVDADDPLVTDGFK
mmetsp:Transcript_14743/g.35023  ORF Transcript_14743/g.35023 Transcript_14743/m.35023 type:complete len:262 (-) Transcript_14743:17-802(-)